MMGPRPPGPGGPGGPAGAPPGGQPGPQQGPPGMQPAGMMPPRGPRPMDPSSNQGKPNLNILSIGYPYYLFLLGLLSRTCELNHIENERVQRSSRSIVISTLHRAVALLNSGQSSAGGGEGV